MSYRETIRKYTVVAEQDDVNKTDFLTIDDAKDIIDEIEQRVNEILSSLDGIEGLTEIDDVKEKLKSLSEDLY